MFNVSLPLIFSFPSFHALISSLVLNIYIYEGYFLHIIIDDVRKSEGNGLSPS